jgi:hypothetical protein
MKLEELLDLTLREIVNTYCVVWNLECGYAYGIFKIEDIDQIIEEYNVLEEYPEAFSPEPLISHEVTDVCEEIRDYEVLTRIMDNLGINKRNDKSTENNNIS